MKRSIQKYVEDALAEELLRGNIKEGASVVLKSAGDKLDFIPGEVSSASAAIV
jgi:ATP-dependent Clp protease ATP-binding subunit ClpA